MGCGDAEEYCCRSAALSDYSSSNFSQQVELLGQNQQSTPAKILQEWRLVLLH